MPTRSYRCTSYGDWNRWIAVNVTFQTHSVMAWPTSTTPLIPIHMMPKQHWGFVFCQSSICVVHVCFQVIDICTIVLSVSQSWIGGYANKTHSRFPLPLAHSILRLSRSHRRSEYLDENRSCGREMIFLGLREISPSLQRSICHWVALEKPNDLKAIGNTSCSTLVNSCKRSSSSGKHIVTPIPEQLDLYTTSTRSP